MATDTWTTLGELRPGLFEDRAGNIAEKLIDKPDRIGYLLIKAGEVKMRMWPGLVCRPVEMAPRKKRREEADA